VNLRWSYVHVPDILATARIPHPSGPPSPLPRSERDIHGIAFGARGERHTVGEVLDATETDGFLVLHRGHILAERYGGHATEATPHLLQSVSKSLTSGLAGALVADGRLDPDAPVTAYVAELRGGSFEGCTVQHLLDMRAGTRFSEEYEDPGSDVRASEEVTGWRPRTRDDLPDDLYRYMAALESAGPHGGIFDYRSILTDVLGWALESAGGDTYANLFARRVWGPLGAEHDAAMTVDAGGAPVPDGGLCVTLRDLGRFGLLYLNHGIIDGRRVLPATWVDRVGTPRPDLVAVFGEGLGHESVVTPTSHYHDQWWVLDADRGIFTGLGIHGQMLLVHRPADAVIVKLSSQPVPLDEAKHDLALAAAIAIGDALEREG
jgi:CubicO group peptidase (beta-lactamase class C family)